MSLRRLPASSQGIDPFDNTQEIYPATNMAQNELDELAQTHVINSKGTTSAPFRAPAAGSKQETRGGRDVNQRDVKTRTMADLRAARESRANEALKMKDEQLRILQHQNNQLLGNLDR